MKKIGIFIGLMTMIGIAKADPLCTNWGVMNVCLPLTSLDAAYGYDFGGMGNQALVETQIATLKKVVAFTFGGAKSVGEPASPYMSITYGIKNPVTDPNNILSIIRPGIYGGKDFSRHAYIYGIKASASIF